MKGFDEEITACVSCMAQNPKWADFCEICSAPLGITSTLDPMKTIRTEGFLLRKAVSERPKFIVLLGMWILFSPWLIGTIAIAVNEIFYGKGIESFFFFLIAVGLTAVIGKILYPVTRNYFTMPELKIKPRAVTKA